MIVEGRPGAGGHVAGELVARATGDGYTLFTAGGALMSLASSLYASLPYSPERDLVPISILVKIPLVLETNLQSPATNFQEFAAWLKRDGAKLNYSVPGLATLPHLASELLKMRLGAESTQVLFRGTAPQLASLLQNETQWMMDVLGSALTQKGKLRPLAVTARERIPELPDVPSFAELGFSEIDPLVTFMLVAPSSMPKDLVDRISAEVGRALRDPVAVARLKGAGLYAAPTTPAETVQHIAAERQRWLPVIQANNIKLE